jgi:hypothetical protein
LIRIASPVTTAEAFCIFGQTHSSRIKAKTWPLETVCSATRWYISFLHEAPWSALDEALCITVEWRPYNAARGGGADHLTCPREREGSDQAQGGANKSVDAPPPLAEPSAEQIARADMQPSLSPERRSTKQRRSIGVPCPIPWRALHVRRWVRRNLFCTAMQITRRGRSRGPR